MWAAVTPDTQPTLFLEGPAGAGKTTQAIERIRSLIDDGVAPDRILLLTPHRSYTLAYEEAFDQRSWYGLGKATIGGLARRYVSLFWPEVLAQSKYPFVQGQEPTFLTYEVAQYFMARLVSPLIEQGYFADLKLTRHRLYSQLLDNLNKAAVNYIPLDALSDYLRSARIGTELSDGHVEEISNTVAAYRQLCAQGNLLDFSLYLTLFWDLVRHSQPLRDYLFGQHRHLVYDNCEEDIPLAHDIVRLWMNHDDSRLESVLILYDCDAGFRKFLAANPLSAYTLKQECAASQLIESTATVPESLQVFGRRLCDAIGDRPDAGAVSDVDNDDKRRVQVFSDRLHHQMVQRVTGQVEQLIENGIEPAQIAIISPFLNDSLYYGLSTRLDTAQISHYVHRPSRTLRDEPVTKVLLTLAALAHPSWRLERPSPEAVTHMFDRLLGAADLVRAALLASVAYEGVHEAVGLKSFEEIASQARDRITYRVGESYEVLRSWLEEYQSEEDLPVDLFFSRLFGEVLSQPGFGFHKDVPAGMQVASLVESAQKFRRAVAEASGDEGEAVGKAYVEMVQEGVVSAFYSMNWADPSTSVLIAPAHTFLLRNRTYAHQLWLDVGSPAWHRRIHQPLTNPYVLSRDWNTQEEEWSSAWEAKFETERLTCMVSGLVRRCTDSVYLFNSELSAHGQEQTGDLLVALGHALRGLGVVPEAEGVYEV